MFPGCNKSECFCKKLQNGSIDVTNFLGYFDK